MSPESVVRFTVLAFRQQDWNALWLVRLRQLAESGVRLDVLPERPDHTSPYEQDYHRIDQVYLSGAGNFWLAWCEQLPVGHIGAQAFDDVVELRRLYVIPEYRRHGVGTALVRTLVEHCTTQRVRAIELWTVASGPGRGLYERFGFRVVDKPGPEFRVVNYPAGEIRMRFGLAIGNRTIIVECDLKRNARR